MPHFIFNYKILTAHLKNGLYGAGFLKDSEEYMIFAPKEKSKPKKRPV